MQRGGSPASIVSLYKFLGITYLYIFFIHTAAPTEISYATRHVRSEITPNHFMQMLLNEDRIHRNDISPFSLTLHGNYTMVSHSTVNNTETNMKEDKYQMLDHGKVRIVFYTHASLIQNIRRVFLRLDLSSHYENRSITRLKLNGLNLIEDSKLILHGSTSSINLFSSIFKPEQLSLLPSSCSLPTTFTFDRSLENTVSVRSVPLELEDEIWSPEIAPLRNNINLDKEANLQFPLDAFDDAPSANLNSSFPLKGLIMSPNCNLQIHISADEIDLFDLGNRAGHFVLLFILKSFFELYLFIDQCRRTEAAVSSAAKVSLMGLQFQMCIDLVEASLSFIQVLTANFMSSFFFFMTLLKIVFIFVLELRYLFTVLKALHPNIEVTDEHFARIIKLNAFVIATALFIVMRFLPTIPALSLVIYSFWVPQIALNIMKGHRRPFNLKFILGVTLCRAFLPLYLYGYPAQIFDNLIFTSITGPPQQYLAWSLGFYLLFQALVLAAQSVYGPRFFIPLSLIPNAYNYYKPFDITADLEKGGHSYECVICMSEVSYIARYTTFYLYHKLSSRTMVVTPCNHHFHELCLHQWMDIKAECPTCRQPLPPFPE